MGIPTTHRYMPDAYPVTCCGLDGNMFYITEKYKYLTCSTCRYWSRQHKLVSDEEVKLKLSFWEKVKWWFGSSYVPVAEPEGRRGYMHFQKETDFGHMRTWGSACGAYNGNNTRRRKDVTCPVCLREPKDPKKDKLAKVMAQHIEIMKKLGSPEELVEVAKRALYKVQEELGDV